MIIKHQGTCYHGLREVCLGNLLERFSSELSLCTGHKMNACGYAHGIKTVEPQVVETHVELADKIQGLIRMPS